jgi:hypothetical protein
VRKSGAAKARSAASAESGRARRLK